MREARGGLERHFYLAGLELATGLAWHLGPCSVVSDGSKEASQEQTATGPWLDVL